MEFAYGSEKVDLAAQDPANHNPGEPEAGYRLLALRSAIFPGDPRNNNPQLYFKMLPPELPAEFPLPSNTRLLGSLARSAQHIDLYLDTSLTNDQIIEFYIERLTGAGWQKIDPLSLPGNPGGFMAGTRPMQNILFCQGSQGPSLTLQTNSDSSADLRIILNLDTTNNPCDQTRQRQMRGRPGMINLIPPLTPPPGNVQNFEGGGSGGNSNSWNSSATLESDLGLVELAAHYNVQLEKAGWQLSGQGINEPVARSEWSLKDQEGYTWQGRFLIYHNFTNTRGFYLQANVTRHQPGSDEQQKVSNQLRF